VNDTISRQQAVKVILADKIVGKTLIVMNALGDGRLALTLNDACDRHIRDIEKLPSAQPEIVRCKDCKHKYIEDNVWKCPFGLSGGENFFCGYGSLGRVESEVES